MRPRSITELFKTGVLKSAILTRTTEADQEKLMKTNGYGDIAEQVNQILAEAAQKISVLCNSQVGGTDDDFVQAEPATVAMSFGALTGTPLFRLTVADRRKRLLDFVWRTHGKANPRA